MRPETILFAMIAINLANFLLDQGLALLNMYRPRLSLDPRLAGFYDEAGYQRAVSYQRSKTLFGLCAAAFSLLIMLIMLWGGGFGRWDGFLRGFIGHPTWLALAFFGGLALAYDLVSLPFQLYATFSLEARYGFNRSSLGLFLRDKLKSWLLSAVLGGLALVGLLALVDWLGSLFWLYFALIAIAFMIFMNMFYTSLIVPLFNTLKPLPEGELRTAIQAFADAHGFSISGIFVIDASKRSSKANAYFSGLGSKKKIVLFDTLVETHSSEELVAVLAHELGHSRLGHIPKRLVAAAAQVLVSLWLFSLFAFNHELSLALGGSAHSLHLNILAFGLLFSPLSFVTGLASLYVSRKHEYQADAFAAATASAEAMGQALKRLSVHNLSYLYPHPAYVFCNYSHPPLLRRLDALEARGA